MTAPRVSVILPVYNGGRFLRPAVDSVLAQTYRDFELIALDDGSTDGSGDLLDDYAQRDPRVRVIHQPNQGLIFTLNYGLNIATGEYIARMDADDLCEPSRFEQQVAYLDAHSEIAVLGTQMRTMDVEGKPLGYSRSPLTPVVVRWTMLIQSALAHPTIMARRERVLQYGGYETEYPHAEDYALWTRMALHDNLDNLPDALLTYRWSDSNISTRYRTVQIANSARIIQRYTRELLGVTISLNQAKIASTPVLEKPLSTLSLDEIRQCVDHTLGLFEIFVSQFSPQRSDMIRLRTAAGDYLYPLIAVAIAKDPAAGLRMGRMVLNISRNPRAIFRRGAGKLRHYFTR